MSTENEPTEGAGKTTASLMGLFEPPTKAEGNLLDDTTAEDTSTTPNLKGASNVFFSDETERTGLMQSLKGDYQTTTPPGTADLGKTAPSESKTSLYKKRIQEFCEQHFQPTTFAGALMFLLYHVVFCLANGSAIIRPHSERPILGIMAKMSSVGILFAAPFYVYRLGSDIPALYPSIDLFLAPFLARAAVRIDDTLAQQEESDGNDDAVFFASFAVLAAIGMFLSGALLLLAASFKLANLGTFLPYSVLCGFFSAVGVLLWALAFSVDANGKTWQSVFFSGDWQLIKTCLIHHLPSLVVGILMNILGPKNPFYVIILIVCTLAAFYLVMFATGTSLEQAQEAEWFWSRDELVYETAPEVGLSAWAPPAPFGTLGVLFHGTVNWTAVSNGVGEMFALSVLYLLRSSIHASAMKKNVGNLVRKEHIHPSEQLEGNGEINDDKSLGNVSFRMNTTTFAKRISTHVRLAKQTLDESRNSVMPFQKRMPRSPKKIKKPVLSGRRISERVDLPLEVTGLATNDDAWGSQEYREIRAKIPKKSLEDIFVEYGYALVIVSFAGGFGVCPTVATSNTMYAIGADGPAPQYGSVLLLVFFYLTDFEIVRFIPKAAFSSLLVLGAVDTFVVWFFLSFRKTQDVLEWLVVPVIVTFSLVVGFLNAVFLGIGIAMFVFVANFFRVGVVKYNSSGLELRSSIERNPTAAEWLDLHGDLIQVLVLQNYLFFGNANSILNYIATMFEEVDENESRGLSFTIPPLPKVLIIDLSLSSGMDTSSYDIFAEIQETVKSNDCKMYLCGLSRRVRAGLALVGVKPSTGLPLDRVVRFFPDLDSALGKAEDLLTSEFDDYRKGRAGPIDRGLRSNGDNRTSGFFHALKQIDEQHSIDIAEELTELEKFTVPIELGPGEQLYDGILQDCERGLWFIESGILRIERDAGTSIARRRSGTSLPSSLATLNRQHARTGSVGRKSAMLKASFRGFHKQQTFRLARIGPGWLVGTIEMSSGLRDTGVHIAVDHCRLHHLPFHNIQQIEQETPVLAMRLYKLIAHLMAYRQETTISQLATLKSIMSSPPHVK